MALMVGGIRYQTTYAKTEIVKASSNDEQYTLFVYMIGEPDWPFGATHCRFDLMNDGKRIIKYTFDIHDDGANATENNFDITWEKENVTIIVSGSEQKNTFYKLSFDGAVERWQEKEQPLMESEMIEVTTCEHTDAEYPRMIMVSDILYYDCDEINIEPHDGSMDGMLVKVTEEVPVENNQSNFGVEYGYQFGNETGKVEVCIDNEWHVFKQYKQGTFKIVDEYLALYYRTGV